MNAPIARLDRGFPTNHHGVRDLLYLNEGNGRERARRRFREVGRRPGIDPAPSTTASAPSSPT